jgi:hypothetical protein
LPLPPPEPDPLVTGRELIDSTVALSTVPGSALRVTVAGWPGCSLQRVGLREVGRHLHPGRVGDHHETRLCGRGASGAIAGTGGRARARTGSAARRRVL